MPDYLHSLSFGTSITPANAKPGGAPALARFSEQLGYNLVTFQDHPYQPAFHDTWTLLTWVAAVTERIHVAPNVLSIPMRPPAVTARAAASLDLLSGGRFDLALGAGAFWDAIEAMGVRRLTPGQAVDALGEAIDVMRGIWAAGERAPLRLSGTYHHVNGAKRGPAPAHDIPVWIGAYKPKMQRLIGRKGDGWLPSTSYLKPGELRTGMRIIDEAAVEAGRDPREIRRLLNVSGTFARDGRGFLDGPGTQWVEDLLPYALEDGVSTFILASDDPASLQRFAEEVAPALREAVARERGGDGGGPTLRSTAVRAARRPGIAYDDVPATLASAAVEPGDARYSRVKSTYIRGGSPGLVLQVRDAAEVADALAFAREHPALPLGVRSGGHGISGRSTNDGGIVIDVSALNTIEVMDKRTRRVRIGPGARWADVAQALAPHGWALSSGDYGGVGVGGLATAGGVGWLAREHGLTIDHLRAADIVLADGRTVHASAEENPDLFWAVRGAGANFGIVVSFEFEVDVVGDVAWAQLVFDASDTAQFLKSWSAVVEAAPRDLTSNLVLGGRRRGRPVYAQVLAVVDSDDPDTVLDRLKPFAGIAPLLDQSIQIVPYAAVMANVRDGGHDGQGEPHAHSGLVEHITPEFAAEAAELIDTGAAYFFQIRSVGGAVSDVPPDATAYANRSANFSVVAFGTNASGLDQRWERLRRHFAGMYLSFETGLDPERIDIAFPGDTLTRLRALKERYDPENVFRDNFNVLGATP
ncbi:LLM class flavin-dependent oxidoreductase [Micromonospora sp. RHAY321]|uniref:LLM class flavin-dependent oxidoreductase n=1 Tax=Micromonospora sp. RHAY321 TaxID=2944807 RepID=UPI00207D4BD1|nr:LLM class flavin-dependent oxidoreductase [Micromonospora sp. RHAY321]MCO1593709.1 LLM class flavin-dependent oxidoreductase [Micromonospora sp. RHAY321]